MTAPSPATHMIEVAAEVFFFEGTGKAVATDARR